MKIKIIAIALCLTLLLSACASNATPSTNPQTESTGAATSSQPSGTTPTAPTQPTQSNEPTEPTEPEFDPPSGGSIEETKAYDGFFEGESKDFTIECSSGTENAYHLDGDVLTFTTVSADSAYTISGTFTGSIVIDTGDDYKFELEMRGFCMVSRTVNPITILSGDEVTLKAKKDTKNYIYDLRAAIDPNDETLYSASIHSTVDLEIGGKGELTVVSENNNGIHTKDNLQVKNLSLFVVCIDNALKGNDGIEMTDCSTTLIASGGDCIKTSNSDVSKKGNQRGDITISGGTHYLYAACDGIDAAHDVVIDSSKTNISIFTDRYSSFSKEVSTNSSSENFIRFTSNLYYYSVKYYNSDTDFVWVNAQYHSKASGSRTTYYYYSYPEMAGYAKQQFFIYEKEAQCGQEEEYLVKSDYLTPNSGCDTFALTNSGRGLTYQWTNYTTKVQEGGFGGFGGMNDGNTDKGEYSTKGIKADNTITINDGTIFIKSYDDAIHANNDNELENGQNPLGNVTINGGSLTLYSNDDGIHADGILAISGGNVAVTNAYEGVEGSQVAISGGYLSIHCSDDGINATCTSGTGITISGGEIYINCTGDGIDCNSRTAYSGIIFSGGKTVVISNSRMNSALDTENGYTYSGGKVVAIMPSGGMWNESIHCANFNQIGKYVQTSLTAGKFLNVDFGDATATVEIPVSMTSIVIVLGSSSPSINVEASTTKPLNENGVCWTEGSMV